MMFHLVDRTIAFLQEDAYGLMGVWEEANPAGIMDGNILRWVLVLGRKSLIYGLHGMLTIFFKYSVAVGAGHQYRFDIIDLEEVLDLVKMLLKNFLLAKVVGGLGTAVKEDAKLRDTRLQFFYYINNPC